MLIVPLYDHTLAIIVSHVAAIAVAANILIHHNGVATQLALAFAVMAMVARLIVILRAKQQRRLFGDTALINLHPWYQAVEFIWSLTGGIFVGLCVAANFDDKSGDLAILLAVAVSSLIARRISGFQDLAFVQTSAWLLPPIAAASFCGVRYLAEAAMLGVFQLGWWSVIRQNRKVIATTIGYLERLQASESEAQALFTHLATGLNEVNPETGTFLRVNREFCRIVGRSEAELLNGISVWEITHPDDQAESRRKFMSINRHDCTYEREKRFVRPDGTAIWTRISVALIAYAEPTRPARYVTIVHDITVRKAAQEALEEKEAIFRLCLRAGRIGYFERDLVNGLLYADAEARAMHGFPEGNEPIPWGEWEALLEPEELARMQLNIEAHHKSTVNERGSSYQFRHLQDGRIRHIETRTHLRFDAQGEPVRATGVAIDITERRLAELRSQHLAYHDLLTNLPNRVLFQIKFDEALETARNGCGFALCYVDLDRFKEVNDTLGHQIGDALLLAVAARLQAKVAYTNTVARIGGDEFAIIVPFDQTQEQQENEIFALAESIINGLTAAFDLEGHHVKIGASIGIAFAPSSATNAEQLLNCADMALYRAKQQGGNRACRFEPEMDVELAACRTLASELRHAYEVGEFSLFYQPIINVANREVVSFEALLRWHHPERGIVGPDKFIPLAEQNGMIIQIGEWVLHEACLQAASWTGQQKVAVNVSAVSFTSPDLVDSVAEALRVSGLDPARLILELTETVMLQDVQSALVTLRKLKNLGVLIALDDFGTGFSSLSYLLRFPFDRIKIDRAFIAGLEQEAQSVTVVGAIIDLCRALGMVTTAEGVETEAQFEILATHGCDHVQGYLISRPMPVAALGAFLAAQIGSGQNSNSQAVRWTPKTGQAAKRESPLGAAGWPKVRHGEYTEEAQS